jgi:hypothetical protein
MTGTKTPATCSDRNNAPNEQQTQQGQENLVKTASRSGGAPEPGKKPLFRS